ncbi:MAG TPA: ATP-dependent Clp protease proteolytic subunit, partial [Pirellulales bacterium]|jgi:ClpP class serine protease
VDITGMAASAASAIAVGGRHVRMVDGGFVMIHRANAPYGGTSTDLQKKIGILRGLDEQLAKVYEARTGRPANHWLDLMESESYFAGQEAVDAGLVDELFSGVANVAHSAKISDPKRRERIAAFLSTSRPARSWTRESIKARALQLRIAEYVDRARQIQMECR